MELARQKKEFLRNDFIGFSIDGALYLLKYKLESTILKMQHFSERGCRYIYLQDGNDHIQFHRKTFKVTTQ